MERAQRDGCGDNGRELEHEQPEAEAGEQPPMGVRQPAEPVQQRTEEHDEGGNRAEGVEARGDETAVPPGQERQGGENPEYQRRPSDEPGGPILPRFDGQERQHRGQDGDPAEINQEGSVRPGHASGVHRAEL